MKNLSISIGLMLTIIGSVWAGGKMLGKAQAQVESNTTEIVEVKNDIEKSEDKLEENKDNDMKQSIIMERISVQQTYLFEAIKNLNAKIDKELSE